MVLPAQAKFASAYGLTMLLIVVTLSEQLHLSWQFGQFNQTIGAKLWLLKEKVTNSISKCVCV